jgi:hypothetical protein
MMPLMATLRRGFTHELVSPGRVEQLDVDLSGYERDLAAFETEQSKQDDIAELMSIVKLFTKDTYERPPARPRPQKPATVRHIKEVWRKKQFFILSPPDGDEETFHYGEGYEDNEQQACQRAINRALSGGFKANHRNLAAFMSDKIEQLILLRD